MPQMAPMWWMTLMTITMIMIMILMMNLFFDKNYSLNNKKVSMTLSKVKKNWKW